MSRYTSDYGVYGLSGTRKDYSSGGGYLGDEETYNVVYTADTRDSLLESRKADSSFGGVTSYVYPDDEPDPVYSSRADYSDPAASSYRNTMTRYGSSLDPTTDRGHYLERKEFPERVGVSELDDRRTRAPEKYDLEVSWGNLPYSRSPVDSSATYGRSIPSVETSKYGRTTLSSDSNAIYGRDALASSTSVPYRRSYDDRGESSVSKSYGKPTSRDPLPLSDDRYFVAEDTGVGQRSFGDSQGRGGKLSDRDRSLGLPDNRDVSRGQEYRDTDRNRDRKRAPSPPGGALSSTEMAEQLRKERAKLLLEKEETQIIGDMRKARAELLAREGYGNRRDDGRGDGDRKARDDDRGRGGRGEEFGNSRRTDRSAKDKEDLIREAKRAASRGNDLDRRGRRDPSPSRGSRNERNAEWERDIPSKQRKSRFDTLEHPASSGRGRDEPGRSTNRYDQGRRERSRSPLMEPIIVTQQVGGFQQDPYAMNQPHHQGIQDLEAIGQQKFQGSQPSTQEQLQQLQQMQQQLLLQQQQQQLPQQLPLSQIPGSAMDMMLMRQPIPTLESMDLQNEMIKTRLQLAQIASAAAPQFTMGGQTTTPGGIQAQLIEQLQVQQLQQQQLQQQQLQQQQLQQQQGRPQALMATPVMNPMVQQQVGMAQQPLMNLQTNVGDEQYQQGLVLLQEQQEELQRLRAIASHPLGQMPDHLNQTFVPQSAGKVSLMSTELATPDQGPEIGRILKGRGGGLGYGNQSETPNDQRRHDRSGKADSSVHVYVAKPEGSSVVGVTFSGEDSRHLPPDYVHHSERNARDEPEFSAINVALKKLAGLPAHTQIVINTTKKELENTWEAVIEEVVRPSKGTLCSLSQGTRTNIQNMVQQNQWKVTVHYTRPTGIGPNMRFAFRMAEKESEKDSAGVERRPPPRDFRPPPRQDRPPPTNFRPPPRPREFVKASSTKGKRYVE